MNNIINDKPNELTESIESTERNDTQFFNTFDNLLNFTDKFDKINILSNKIEELFTSSNVMTDTSTMNNVNDIDESQYVIFNYLFDKEIEIGNIEYKRSLESYNENEKMGKLIRQIHWRIYEGIVSVNKECCYYIIGIEDSGLPSFLTKAEIFNSIRFISECILETELKYSYLFVKNTLLNYDFLIVKFYPETTNFIDYF